MSFKSQSTVNHLLKVLSSSCEGIIFMCLGIATVVNTYQLNIAFIISTVAACLISRVIGKYLFFCFLVTI